MNIRIITDSTADLPAEVAKELGIMVVPLYVRFGEETFRDGIEITADKFYQRLLEGPVLPVTSAPSPGFFKDLYQKVSSEADGIISIQVSSKLSATYESALNGKKEVSTKCRIEVIDSQFVSMALGLLAITAAKAARAGASMDEIVKLIGEAIPAVYLAAALDTLEFLQKGGRIGKAQAWFGSVLSIKPIISLHEGEVIGLERVRTRSKAIERLYQLAEGHLPAQEAAVVYSTEKAEADKLVDHLKNRFPRQPVYLARFGPVLGTYVGPGSLAIVTLK